MVVIFIVFFILLSTIVLHFLKPLFSFLRYRSGFDRARTASLNMPWIILVFQIIAWTSGTTTYYAVQNWNAESGIPFALGLALKLAGGIIAAVYALLLINLQLIPLKEALNITDIRESENDIFFRYKDEISVLSIAIYLVINYSYITYYFSGATRSYGRGGFYAIMGILGLFYLAVSYGLIYLSKKNYYRQIETLQRELTSLSAGTSDLSNRVVITHFNELGDMAISINSIVRNFANLLKQIRDTVSLLTESAHSLSSAAQENSSTSNQQAASVKEVVSTMEDSNRLTKSVGQNIDEVASRSVRTKEDVQEGFTIIRENKEKMEEVRDANTRTISGVKNLNDEIGSIWEIVKIINGIAGQIKIIAFNAELEASAAGEAGKNFEIVANEIRRLADRTVGSTTEIRKKIGEIQGASDSLIGFSEEGTKKINEGWEMASNIEIVFENILSIF